MRNAINIRALIVGVAMAPLVAGVALAIQTSHPTAKHHEHHGQKWHERLRDDQDRDHDCHRVEPPAPAPTPSSTPSPTPTKTIVPTPTPTPDPVPSIVAHPTPAPTSTPVIPTPKPPKAPVVFPPEHNGPCSRADLDPVEKLACKWWSDL